MRTITIFGGSGFLGRYIVQELAPLGYKIRIIVRNPNNALFLKIYGKVGQIELVRGDIADAKSLQNFVSGSDCIINCVAIFYGSSSSPDFGLW